MVLGPKNGARSREALISTAKTVIPEKKASVKISHRFMLFRDGGWSSMDCMFICFLDRLCGQWPQLGVAASLNALG